MDSLKLHTSPTSVFSGSSVPVEKAKFLVFGAPYDRTSTYRAGSRFGPAAIREASLNIETYSIRHNIDLERIPLCDLGDLHVVDDMDETLRRLERVTRDIVDSGKIAVMLGGEHTMTLAAIRALGPNVGVVSFDAHGDLRDEYSALKIMHATFMRRVAEFVGPEKIVEFGLRALCSEEVDYIRKNRVKHLTSPQILEGPLSAVSEEASNMLAGFERIYVTVDMDVFDPAFAPGVGNPEADGLTPMHFFSLLAAVLKKRIAGFDVVETAPDYDTSGATAVLASRVIFEIISGIETTKS